jgi:hypothetical protein
MNIFDASTTPPGVKGIHDIKTQTFICIKGGIRTANKNI